MACNKKCEVYSRIVGYYRPFDQWNEGKQSEFRQRTTYKLMRTLECGMRNEPQSPEPCTLTPAPCEQSEPHE